MNEFVTHERDINLIGETLVKLVLRDDLRNSPNDGSKVFSPFNFYGLH